MGLQAWRSASAHSGMLLSAFEDVRGNRYVGGFELRSQRVFGARVPMRAHGCAVDPRDASRVIYFARRPGTLAFEYERETHAVRIACETPPGRHFAGHGAFSPDGAWLFTPEHDYERARGWLAVRDARTFRVVELIDTAGIDPHELVWSADGERVIVANGGILTHPRSFRRKLNIPTMDPSLCVFDARRGACLEQWRLPDHLSSIRHLALAANGAVVAGLQYEGDPTQAPSLAALYEPGVGLRELPAPAWLRARVRGYVASIAVSDRTDVIAAACPYGQGAACWSLSDGSFTSFIAAAQTYGMSVLADGALAASQRDGTSYILEDGHSRSRFVTPNRESPIRWDDHWVAA